MKSPTGRVVSFDIESYDLRHRAPDGSLRKPVIIMSSGDAPAIVCDLSALEERVLAWQTTEEMFRRMFRRGRRKAKGWRRHIRRMKAKRKSHATPDRSDR